MTDIEQVRIIEVTHVAPGAQKLIDKVNAALRDGWVLVAPPATVALVNHEYPMTTTFVLGLPRKPEPLTYSITTEE